MRRHQQGAERVELDHGAEALGRPDPEQQLMDELGALGHHGDRDAGAGADEGGQHDQPDLVGTDQRAQGLRRVQHRIAEGAAWPVVAGRGRGSPGGPVLRTVRDG